VNLTILRTGITGQVSQEAIISLDMERFRPNYGLAELDEDSGGVCPATIQTFPYIESAGRSKDDDGVFSVPRPSSRSGPLSP
jgi:hypothetical protein